MLNRLFSKKLQLIHLGGQGEIGKNMTLLKYGNNIIIIDCGMKFPDDEMFGIDKVIPDMSYLVKHKDLVRGLVLTHGHEDHIGAIPYLLKDLNPPIYGTKLTLGLVEHKLKEAKLLKKAKLHAVKAKDVINLGPFKIEFLRVCHSIADAVALSITTPAGVVVHTGDFKIDYTPIDGETVDLNRFGEIGDHGVLVMMSDSTNADTSGSTPSEKTVGETFNRIFGEVKGRIIVATFASNIHRIQQVINTAHKYGRKIAISGLSMQNVVNTAKELGYLKVPKDILVKLDDIHKSAHHHLVILTTGSQGEPMAALSRMAHGEHKQVKIQKGDTVIVSAIPIPGNEKSVYRTIDKLFKFGANVIYEERHWVHVSGHGSQDDMKLMLNLVRPKYFIPTHGEYRHLIAHAQIAQEIGMKHEQIFIDENGDVLNIAKDKVTKSPKLIMEDILVDGTGVGDIGAAVLAERRRLAEGGIVTVNIVAAKDDFRKLSEINIETKGFVFVKSSEDLLHKSRDIVENVILRHKHHFRNVGTVKHEIQKELGKFLRKKTQREPIIIPIITQI